MRMMIVAALLPLAACGNVGGDASPGLAPSGSGNERSWPVSGFDQVELAGGDDVSVSVGSGYSVRAEGDSAALDRLKITRAGNRLSISRRNGLWPDRRDVHIYVTLPALTATSLSGSGGMTVDRIEGDRFRATNAGSGSLRLGQLRVRDAEISLAGSGDIAAAGEARHVAITVAGSGNVAAARLVAADGDVDVAGSGNVRATVRGRATVRMAGSGSVELGGAPTCTVSKTGSGSVRCA